jgi:glycosyltransferase involved in cell wall biosynthesis
MQQLPKLAYIGDVPVESSYSGPALLFRLLQDYPGAQVFIVEGINSSQSERRLPGVMYARLWVGWERLLRTRFHRLYCSWLSVIAILLKARRVNAILQGYCPEAVLTVGEGFSWITAAAFARASGLPLHLVIHDDWPDVSGISPSLRSWLGYEFARVYREAASRLCISPYMEEVYYRRYGVRGTVLYPSRASDCPQFDAPPERIARNDHSFTVAFGGTINSPDYVNALVNMAIALVPVGGRLIIFGPLTPETARQVGLECPNIVLRGLLKSSELMTRLREEADALFVPMSFHPAEATNMKMGFPSKLTDYTAVGLPLLIYGPDYCSAVRWARENPDVAEVIDAENAGPLAEAVRRLNGAPDHRMALGRRALEAGRRYFTYEAVQQVFQEALVGTREPTR